MTFSSQTSGPAIYVPAVGQYDNIGDIILRRELLNWLEKVGKLHVYVGNSPSGYDKGLNLPHSARLYRSFTKWFLAGLGDAARRRAHYAFKPGEIQLSIAGLKEHVALLPLLLAVRAGGGKVLRIGSGARNFDRRFRPLIMPSILCCNIVRWRDAETAQFFGRGAPMPDLAFAQGPSTDVAFAARDRSKLVVSMRGDQALPGETWFSTIQSTAQRLSIDICVVSQVQRDTDHARKIAGRLGAELVYWDGTNHDAFETSLRDVYARAELVISDRLHVCIAAVTEGAIPVCMMEGRSSKIERHFSAAGFGVVSVDLTENTSSSASDELVGLVSGRAQISERLASARQAIYQVESDALRVLGVRGIH